MNCFFCSPPPFFFLKGVRTIGKQTWGVDNFYNGSISKSQKGLEISVISVVDVSAHQGYTLSVKQTATTEHQPIPLEQPTVKKKRKSKSKAKANAKTKTEPVISERVKGYLEQLKITRAHLPAAVKYLVGDSFYSKKAERANFHSQMGDLQQAISDYDRAIELQPHNRLFIHWRSQLNDWTWGLELTDSGSTSAYAASTEP